MIEGSIKIQSLSTEITQLRAHSERQALAYKSSKPSPASLFNTQENHIIDDVSISSAAVKQLEDAKALNNQLQKYLDYLKGKNKGDEKIRLVPANNNREEIAARATSFDASITAGKITEEILEIDFTLDDNGSVTELTVSASKTTTEFVSAEFTLSDTQFYVSGV